MKKYVVWLVALLFLPAISLAATDSFGRTIQKSNTALVIPVQGTSAVGSTNPMAVTSNLKAGGLPVTFNNNVAGGFKVQVVGSGMTVTFNEKAGGFDVKKIVNTVTITGNTHSVANPEVVTWSINSAAGANYVRFATAQTITENVNSSAAPKIVKPASAATWTLSSGESNADPIYTKTATASATAVKQQVIIVTGTGATVNAGYSGKVVVQNCDPSIRIWFVATTNKQIGVQAYGVNGGFEIPSEAVIDLEKIYPWFTKNSTAISTQAHKASTTTTLNMFFKAE